MLAHIIDTNSFTYNAYKTNKKQYIHTYIHTLHT